MNLQEAKKLEKKILETLKKYIKNNDTVVAGISGGPDSMFLLHFLEKIPAKKIIAHINHKLRKEADKEEKFVKEFVETLRKKTDKISFHSIKKEIKKFSQKLKTGLEETGRKIRYDYFKKLAKKYKAKFIITAHHADDNLETIIINFVRGASLQGLAGIQELENNIFRPLLNITKKNILEYLKLKRIPFKQDKTNKDKKYARNFIRHEIIPKLKKLNPNLVETITKNVKNIREINEHLRKNAQKWLKAQKSQTRLNVKLFRKVPTPLQKIILMEIYKQHVGNTKNIENNHIDEILRIIHQNVGNKKKKFGKLQISLEGGIIKIGNS